jgi:hypothetical protein
MGFAEKILNSACPLGACLFSNSRRALALAATDAAVLGWAVGIAAVKLSLFLFGVWKP